MKILAILLSASILFSINTQAADVTTSTLMSDVHWVDKILCNGEEIDTSSTGNFDVIRVSTDSQIKYELKLTGQDVIFAICDWYVLL